MLRIAHRVSSIAKLKKALDSSYEGIEIDLRMTTDGVVIVNHDRVYNNFYGRNSWVDRAPFDELKESYDGQVLTFDELLTVLFSYQKKQKVILDLDIKQQNIHDAVYDLLSKHHAFSKTTAIIISSPDVWVLESFSQLNNRFKLGLTLSSLSYNDRYDLYNLKVIRYLSVVLQYTFKPFLFRLIRRKAKRNKSFDYANVYYKLIDRDIVGFLQEQGMKVLIYCVDKKGDIQRLESMGIDGVKTTVK